MVVNRRFDQISEVMTQSFLVSLIVILLLILCNFYHHFYKENHNINGFYYAMPWQITHKIDVYSFADDL